MAPKTGKFNISFADGKSAERSYEKDSIFIGRLVSSEIVLDHKTVSRIHAGLNFRDGRYEIANLSSSSKITINGRALPPQKEDVLADGDNIQIGPFLIVVSLNRGELSLNVQGQVADRVPEKPLEIPPPLPPGESTNESMADVLQVFWEKRSREKEDWGTRLRPTEKTKTGQGNVQLAAYPGPSPAVAVGFICLGIPADRRHRGVCIFSLSDSLRAETAV
jgi:pSer/pThr/pTyr-binding forkhead associated (FHA) protein